MSAKKLLWKIPLGVVSGVLGLVLLVLVAVACVLYVPSIRSAALEKGLAVANEKSDLDINL